MAKARKDKETDLNRADPGASPVPDPEDAAGGNGNSDRRVEGYSTDRVAARAYELYLARGGADGQDFDDWLTAERELSSGPGQGDRRE